MFDDINLLEIQNKLVKWFVDFIWTVDCGAQAIIVLVSFGLAFLIARITKPRLNDLINKLSVPFRLTEILYSGLKLVFPFIAMVFIFIGSKIAGPAGLDLNVTFTFALVKVLLAWIVIKTVSQFIEQRFARNVIALTVLALVALSIFGVMDQTMTLLDSIGFSIGDFRLSALTVTKGIFGIFILLYGALFL